LKIGKLLNRGRSHNAQNAQKTCNPEFIVRLLYGDSFKNQSPSWFKPIKANSDTFVPLYRLFPDGHRLVVGMFHASHDIGLKRVPFLDKLIHALGQLTINSPPRKLILFAKAIAVKGR
jgi:hypothetical protein